MQGSPNLPSVGNYHINFVRFLHQRHICMTQSDFKIYFIHILSSPVIVSVVFVCVFVCQFIELFLASSYFQHTNTCFFICIKN